MKTLHEARSLPQSTWWERQGSKSLKGLLAPHPIRKQRAVKADIQPIVSFHAAQDSQPRNGTTPQWVGLSPLQQHN